MDIDENEVRREDTGDENTSSESTDSEDSDTDWDSVRHSFNWANENNIFGLHDGGGLDMVIAASDGMEFVVHSSKLCDMFRQISIKEDIPRFSSEPPNFQLWIDGPSTEALLAFLSTGDKTLMENNSIANGQMIKFGYRYGLQELVAGAIQVLIEHIGSKVSFRDPIFLWELNTWIVKRTDRNNGELPAELVALKAVISKHFNRKVTNSRKHWFRSPAASYNIFGNFWEMNVNLLL